jgi:hypothetical protein
LNPIINEFSARFTRMLRPGIGQLGTYSPRPVSLTSALSDTNLTGQSLPKISIVVPTYNQGKFIDKTLQSIIDQQYQNLELIVVDGGSTDNTLSIIKQYESYIAWWISEPDSGQTAAINKGFSRSSGEIMAWINSDDLIAPGALKFVAEYFTKHPEVQTIYGNRILINEEGLEIGRWILPYHSNRVLKWVDYVPQETLYWTREAWNQVGGQIDEAFSFAMDWDFLLRLRKKEIGIKHIPQFLGFFRIHHQQKTSSQMPLLGQKEMRDIRCREIGFRPMRWLVIINILPFLLVAKIHELSWKIKFNQNVKV